METTTMIKQAKELDKSMSHKAIILPQIEYGDGNIIYAKNAYKLTSEAERELIEDLGVPGPFWGRIDQELKNTVANHLIRKQQDTERLIHLYDDGSKQFLGIQNVKSPVIGIEEMANYSYGIMDTIGEKWELNGFRIHPDACMAEFLLPELINVDLEKKRLKRKGDIIKVGGTLEWSPVNRTVASVQQYVYRLVCTNGAIAPRLSAKMNMYGRSRDSVFERMGKAFVDVFANLPHLVEAYKASTMVTIDNLDHHMDNLFAANSLPASLRQAVLDALGEEIETLDRVTAWNVANAFTRAANADGMAYATRRTLQSLGGAFARDHKADCPTCHRELN